MATTTNQHAQAERTETAHARLRWARALSRLGQATASALRDIRL